MRNQLLFKVVCISIVTLLLSAASATSSGGQANAVSRYPLEGSFVPNEILIGLKLELAQRLLGQKVTLSQMGIISLDQLNRKYAVQQISPVFADFSLTDPVAAQYGLAGVFKLTVPLGTDIFAMIAEYQKDPAIAYAEPNRICRITALIVRVSPQQTPIVPVVSRVSVGAVRFSQ